MLRIESRILVTFLILPTMAVCQSEPKPQAKEVKPAATIQVQPQLPPAMAPGRPIIPGVPLVRAPQRPLEFVVVDSFSPAGNAPATLGKFIDSEIASMSSFLKLKPEQLRQLQVAAKGVQHRARRKEAAKAEIGAIIVPAAGGPNNRFVVRNLRWGFQPAVAKSQQFKAQLEESRLWNKTLKRVLSQEQLDRWKHSRAKWKPGTQPPAQTIRATPAQFPPR